jgi:hypothetical protein
MAKIDLSQAEHKNNHKGIIQLIKLSERLYKKIILADWEKSLKVIDTTFIYTPEQLDEVKKYHKVKNS